MNLRSIFLVCSLAITGFAEDAAPQGHLIIHGGGPLTADVVECFVEYFFLEKGQRFEMATRRLIP